MSGVSDSRLLPHTIRRSLCSRLQRLLRMVCGSNLLSLTPDIEYNYLETRRMAVHYLDKPYPLLTNLRATFPPLPTSLYAIDSERTSAWEDSIAPVLNTFMGGLVAACVEAGIIPLSTD